MILAQTPDILTVVAKELPVAGAIIGTVLIFMRSMTRRDQAQEKQQERWFDAWKTWNTEQASVRREDLREMIGVIRENTVVLGGVKTIVADLLIKKTD